MMTYFDYLGGKVEEYATVRSRDLFQGGMKCFYESQIFVLNLGVFIYVVCIYNKVKVSVKLSSTHGTSSASLGLEDVVCTYAV